MYQYWHAKALHLQRPVHQTITIHLTPLNKLRMSALLNTASILNKKDTVSAMDSVKPTRNNHDCLVARESRKRLLDTFLRLDV